MYGWPPAGGASTSRMSPVAGSCFRQLRTLLGVPDEFMPIGVMPVGQPLPDVRSPSLKRGRVLFEEFARWERWT